MSRTCLTTAVIIRAIIFLLSFMVSCTRSNIPVPPLLTNATAASIIPPPTLPSQQVGGDTYPRQDSPPATNPASSIIRPPTLRPSITQSQPSSPTSDSGSTTVSHRPPVNSGQGGSNLSNSPASSQHLVNQFLHSQQSPGHGYDTYDSQPLGSGSLSWGSGQGTVSHTGSNTNNAGVPSVPSQPGAVDSNTDDFVCYDNKLSIIMKDVPCPTPGVMGTRKVEVSTAMLEGLLTGMGGGVIKPVMSVEPPEHLSAFNLTDIGSSDWLNFNRTDLTDHLLYSLQQLEQNQLHLEQQLSRYISCDCLHNLTHLADVIIDIMNTSSHLNLCSNSALNTNRLCEELLAAIQDLKFVNHQIETLLSSADNPAAKINASTAFIQNITVDDTHDDNNTDILIDQLLASLNNIQSETKAYHLLHQKLQSAIITLKGIVYQTGEEFFHRLLAEVENHQFGNQDNGVPRTMAGSKPTTSAVSVDLSFREDQDDQDKSNSFTTERHPLNFTEPDKVNVSQGKLSQNISFTSSNQSRDEISTTEPAISEHEEPASLADLLQSISAILGTQNETRDHSVNTQTEEQIFHTLDQLHGHLNTITDMLQDTVVLEREKDEVLENMTSWHRLRRRTRRDATGFAIASDSCQIQGNNVAGTNYISLCSACVHTTVLDEEYFPRYLTEKICTRGTSSDDIYGNACLHQPGSFGGGAGGVCQQQEFHIVILQRVPGKCMRVSNHGQEMITDEWQSSTHSLRIGCECMVDQNSQFAKYVTFP